jgi:hypothetical protein
MKIDSQALPEEQEKQFASSFIQLQSKDCLSEKAVGIKELNTIDMTSVRAANFIALNPESDDLLGSK